MLAIMLAILASLIRNYRCANDEHAADVEDATVAANVDADVGADADADAHNQRRNDNDVWFAADMAMVMARWRGHL